MSVQKLIIYLITLTCSIILILTIICLSIPKYIETNSDMNQFKTYLNSFKIISDKMTSLNVSSDSYTVYIHYTNNKIFCRLDNENIEITDQEKNALNNIDKAFYSSNFNRINVYKNKVVFCTEENQHAIEYFINNNITKDISALAEGIDKKVKKIDENWYYISN